MQRDSSDPQKSVESPKRKCVDPERLRKMGFPEGVIQEAVAREESGVLDHEPPADLVEKTIEACKGIAEAESRADAERAKRVKKPKGPAK
jgi:hypothetical protein